DKKNIDINNYFPINAYGKSKLEADLSIIKLSDNYFKVQIIRTPVIYGPDCKGNFPKLQKLAKLMFIVPRITNQKSMIYIENFTEFIKQSINHMLEGVFYPQNSRYMSTSDILILTRKYMGKKTLQTTLMNPLLRFLSKYSSIFRKIFGNKTYDLSLSNYSLFNYNIVSVEESIKKSLEGHK
ncbi:MAG: hypothetical protein RBQ97_05120, partial [Acholeplasma sp.]|nr:hypothetical protein [Acholeplasma sp.]